MFLLFLYFIYFCVRNFCILFNYDREKREKRKLKGEKKEKRKEKNQKINKKGIYFPFFPLFTSLFSKKQISEKIDPKLLHSAGGSIGIILRLKSQS